MTNREKLEQMYESLKSISAKIIKAHFNLKMDADMEYVKIPYQHCKTKIAAQKYINNLINDEVMKEQIEDNEIKEIFNQLQKMQETQAKLIDTVDRNFKVLNTKLQWNK